MKPDQRVKTRPRAAPDFARGFLNKKIAEPPAEHRRKSQRTPDIYADNHKVIIARAITDQSLDSKNRFVTI